jgi:type II secretory pathway predicted ATPase ExeA
VRFTRLVGASRSGVLKALDRFGVPRSDGDKRIGPVPFGFDYLNHRLVKNAAEQGAIRMMLRHRANGLSLREIAGTLNQRLVPTKQNGIWQANTVRGILARA